MKIPLRGRAAPRSLGRRRGAISSICKRSNRISLASGLFVPPERHSHTRIHARTHRLVYESGKYMALYASRVPFPLFVPLLISSLSLSPSLFTLSFFSLSLGTLEKRRRLYHRSFASRYTLVMGHFERGRNCSRFIWRALESTEEVQVHRADNRLNATQRSIKRRPVFRARQYEGELAGGWFGGVQFVNDRCQREDGY